MRRTLTIGDKLLPAFLTAMEERPGTVIENLDRAEKLGLIDSSDAWATMRKLRNRMIHEYVKHAAELADALTVAHEFVPALVASMHAITARLRSRADPQETASMLQRDITPLSEPGRLHHLSPIVDLWIPHFLRRIIK